MKKSKKIIIGIIILLIIVVLIILGICLFTGNKDKVKETYSNLQNSEKFTFTMEEVDSMYTISFAQNGDNMNIDMISNDDDRLSTLILDGNSYTILHSQQEYYMYENEGTEENIILEALEEISEAEYETGSEEIYGTKYYYEEFEGCFDFTILLAIDTNNTIKTRFYFDGDELVYIKNVTTVDDEETEELIKVTVSYDVDDSLFEIPTDYAEVE